MTGHTVKKEPGRNRRLGHLPNNLTVEKTRAGNSNIRNPILISYIAKGLLPYKGLGSGIKRVLEEWPQIEFTDDREGCLFTVTVHRSSEKIPRKSFQKIIEIMQRNPGVTIAGLSEQVGISDRAIEKQLSKLKEQNLIRRIGPAKGGCWEVVE